MFESMKQSQKANLDKERLMRGLSDSQKLHDQTILNGENDQEKEKKDLRKKDNSRNKIKMFGCSKKITAYNYEMEVSQVKGHSQMNLKKKQQEGIHCLSGNLLQTMNHSPTHFFDQGSRSPYQKISDQRTYEAEEIGETNKSMLEKSQVIRGKLKMIGSTKNTTAKIDVIDDNLMLHPHKSLKVLSQIKNCSRQKMIGTLSKVKPQIQYIDQNVLHPHKSLKVISSIKNCSRQKMIGSLSKVKPQIQYIDENGWKNRQKVDKQQANHTGGKVSNSSVCVQKEKRGSRNLSFFKKKSKVKVFGAKRAIQPKIEEISDNGIQLLNHKQIRQTSILQGKSHTQSNTFAFSKQKKKQNATNKLKMIGCQQKSLTAHIVEIKGPQEKGQVKQEPKINISYVDKKIVQQNEDRQQTQQKYEEQRSWRININEKKSESSIAFCEKGRQQQQLVNKSSKQHYILGNKAEFLIKEDNKLTQKTHSLTKEKKQEEKKGQTNIEYQKQSSQKIDEINKNQKSQECPQNIKKTILSEQKNEECMKNESMQENSKQKHENIQEREKCISQQMKQSQMNNKKPLCEAMKEESQEIKKEQNQGAAKAQQLTSLNNLQITDTLPCRNQSNEKSDKKQQINEINDRILQQDQEPIQVQKEEIGQKQKQQKVNQQNCYKKEPIIALNRQESKESQPKQSSNQIQFMQIHQAQEQIHKNQLQQPPIFQKPNQPTQQQIERHHEQLQKDYVEQQPDFTEYNEEPKKDQFRVEILKDQNKHHSNSSPSEDRTINFQILHPEIYAKPDYEPKSSNRSNVSSQSKNIRISKNSNGFKIGKSIDKGKSVPIKDEKFVQGSGQPSKSVNCSQNNSKIISNNKNLSSNFNISSNNLKKVGKFRLNDGYNRNEAFGKVEQRQQLQNEAKNGSKSNQKLKLSSAAEEYLKRNIERNSKIKDVVSPYITPYLNSIKKHTLNIKRNAQYPPKEQENGFQNSPRGKKISKNPAEIISPSQQQKIDNIKLKREPLKKNSCNQRTIQRSIDRSGRRKSINNTRSAKKIPTEEDDNSGKKHEYLKAHSHQFSYLYPTKELDKTGDNMNKKVKVLEKKLSKNEYPLNNVKKKSRMSQEVHEYISQARREIEESQKFLQELEN